MYQKILLPLDGSELAGAVLPHVRAIAQRYNAEIVLLRVPEYVVFDPAVVTPTIFTTVYDAVKTEASEYVGRIAVKLKEAGFNVTAEVRDGAVVETILDYADHIHADLIAMSTHGRSGVARWLLGSVADKIVRGAKTPVLLIRPQT